MTRVRNTLWTAASSLIIGFLIIPVIPEAGFSQAITDVQFDWSTHSRDSEGGDNWPTTWAANGNQYTHGGDGFGWNSNLSPKRGNYVVEISGDKDNYAGEDRFTSDGTGCGDLCGKSYGILAINDVLYMWLAPNSDTSNWDSQTLYKSTDDGLSWSSVGVQFTESDGIGAPTILQFGQENAAARDQYVYMYWTVIQQPDSWDIQTPGEIYLSRVPASSIESESAYEWLVSVDQSNQPSWGSLGNAIPVFEDSTGLMRNSAIYNPGLDTYILVTEHGADDEGNIHMAQGPEPWGPWTTFYRKTGWPERGQVQQNTFFWNFSPKWLSADGTDFVLVFTGKQNNDSWNTVEGSFILSDSTSDTNPPAAPTNLEVVPEGN